MTTVSVPAARTSTFFNVWPANDEMSCIVPGSKLGTTTAPSTTTSTVAPGMPCISETVAVDCAEAADGTVRSAVAANATAAMNVRFISGGPFGSGGDGGGDAPVAQSYGAAAPRRMNALAPGRSPPPPIVPPPPPPPPTTEATQLSSPASTAPVVEAMAPAGLFTGDDERLHVVLGGERLDAGAVAEHAERDDVVVAVEHPRLVRLGLGELGQAAGRQSRCRSQDDGVGAELCGLGDQLGVAPSGLAHACPKACSMAPA